MVVLDTFLIHTHSIICIKHQKLELDDNFLHCHETKLDII